MQVRFIFTMYDAVVNKIHCEQITLEWVGELPQIHAVRIPPQWLTTSQILLEKMEGLTAVGYSSLEIQPLS